MYKLFFNIILIFLLMSLPAHCSLKKASIMVSGRTIADKAIVSRGVAYVPLGKVMGVLKMKYKWNPSKRTLTVNGKPITGKLLKYNGVYYISYLSVSQSTGLPVAYDTIYNKVYINPNMSADDLIASFGGRKPAKKAPPKPAPPKSDGGFIKEPFEPLSAENDIFKVSVTNLEESFSVKGQQPSSNAKKFITVYLSQQNISNEVQIYTGKFALLDRNDRVYEYSEGLSNFWLVVLRPSGANFGYIVFEVPVDASAKQLVLSTTARPPLVINFK